MQQLKLLLKWLEKEGIMTELQALLCLNAVSGLGSLRIRRLLTVFGSGLAVWRQNERKLRGVEGIGGETAKNILHFDCAAFLDEEGSLMREHEIQVVTFFDAKYPQYLKQVPDPPIVLYLKGDWQQVKFPGIAVVGSRRASIYGQSVAKFFGSQLARVGITVISGMARGIDTSAHQGCLKAGGKTVAVLGSGLVRIYPPESKGLYDQIVASGCIISEFPMMTGPYAGNFPRRNRIISGLSAGVVVVEAAKRSGALITSRYALEQGREVFAVPGKIGQAQACGTNALIQQGAKLVSCVDDILEEFPDLGCMIKRNDFVKGSEIELPDDCRRLLTFLSDEPAYIDEILMHSGYDRQTVMKILLACELNGRVKRLPGNYFILNNLR